MRFQLFYPIRPHKVNQIWGLYNSFYEQFGFKRHNGVDLDLVNGQPIYAPQDSIVIRRGEQTGGGIFIGILTKDKWDFDDGVSAQVLMDFLHCKEIVAFEGDEIRAGDIIAYGDNTGTATTGPHAHIQFRRVSYDGRTLIDIDKNEANNSFDPAPYWNGIYADSWQTLRLLQAAVKKLLEWVSSTK